MNQSLETWFASPAADLGGDQLGGHYSGSISSEVTTRRRSGSGRYDAQLRELAAGGSSDPEELFFELALDDVRQTPR